MDPERVDRCWIDGTRCPYGEPDGKFELRPTLFCRVGVCAKLCDEATLRELRELVDCQCT